eukprot:GEZU01026759.1.p1 GENE.GEZU01026759.1~~GEZU01026759.1.p1  ORF type:complete len:190 (+),score=28.43 GEZU01026759.1:1268-1837(+)
MNASTNPGLMIHWSIIAQYAIFCFFVLFAGIALIMRRKFGVHLFQAATYELIGLMVACNVMVGFSPDRDTFRQVYKPYEVFVVAYIFLSSNISFLPRFILACLTFAGLFLFDLIYKRGDPFDNANGFLLISVFTFTFAVMDRKLRETFILRKELGEEIKISQLQKQTTEELLYNAIARTHYPAAPTTAR